MRNSVKLVYIISDIGKALAFEWVAQRLKSQFDLTFILIGNSDTELQKFLESIAVRCFVVDDRRLGSAILKWMRVIGILRKIRPDIVHTHLWRANLMGLSAAWLIRIKRRVMTRHHAMLHYIEYPSGRKWDVLCNRLATDVIAVSKNVSDILLNKDKIPPEKVHLIHHGFDFSYFAHVEPDRVAAVRARTGIAGQNRPVIGVVARYLKLKGIQYIIPAFHHLLDEYPEALLVLANAHGDYAHEIRKQLSTLPAGSYVEILYENDLAALFRLFDVYVHVPIDRESEAFGQTYVEALAVGVPSVFTISGVAPELVEEDWNALVVPFCNSESIHNSMLRILRDPDLHDRLIVNGKSTSSFFSIDRMINLLVGVYEQ